MLKPTQTLNNPKPQTLKPQTLNPETPTLNPEPCTLNPTVASLLFSAGGAGFVVGVLLRAILGFRVWGFGFRV